MGELRQPRRARARRRGAEGHGSLQAWAIGETASAPAPLDERALAAALGPVLQDFGGRGGRVLCLLWTYEPPDEGVVTLAAHIARATLGSPGAASAASGSGAVAQPVPFALAVASMLAVAAQAAAEAEADGGRAT
jgi:hypothetical protein